MAKKVFRVEVHGDHLSKVSNSNPDKALAEIIWNALDADATEIDVFIVDGPIGAETIIVRDNGLGFSIDEAESFFRGLGGSWKSARNRSEGGRLLHGREGQGRFKVFSLGRHVEWLVKPEPQPNLDASPFKLAASADNLEEFSIEPMDDDHDLPRGVKVTVRELNRTFHILDPEKAVSKLLPLFAIYLRTYPGISITVGGIRLDPAGMVRSSVSISLGEVEFKGKKYPVDVEIIEWKDVGEKELWYCSSSGFPLEKYSKQIRSVGDYGFSAYLKSDLIALLSADGTLGLGELNAHLTEVSAAAINEIKRHFSERTIEEGREQIRRWKSESVYPFLQEAVTPTEIAERQIFDIVAVKISESLPVLDKGDKKTKAFQLRMLRNAVENGPEDLQNVISEVLNLPKEKLEQLSLLLKDVSLSGVISASKMVSDRLKFIDGLEFLLFDQEAKKNLKERSQLHRIIAENTWIFGNEFSVSVDDQSLTEVLRKHRVSHGSDTPIDEPVKRVDGTVGIVDLMLSRSIPRAGADEIEHLVVELKAPKVKIGHEECTQIESYAFAVIKDARFASLSSTWNFVIISNEMDAYATLKATQAGRARGILYQNLDGTKVTIWVKTWSQILRENRHRLQFVRDKINYSVDRKDAVKHLRETYAEFTKGVFVEGAHD